MSNIVFDFLLNIVSNIGFNIVFNIEVNIGFNIGSNIGADIEFNNGFNIGFNIELNIFSVVVFILPGYQGYEFYNIVIPRLGMTDKGNGGRKDPLIVLILPSMAT